MPFPDYLIALPMVAAVISLWFSRRAWLVFFLLFMVAGFWLGRLTALSLISIGVGFVLALAVVKCCPVVETAGEGQQRPPLLEKSLYLALSLLLVIWAFLMFFHQLPGFHNILLLDKVYVSPDAIPYTLYFNLDKPIIIFALFVAMPGLLGSGKAISDQRKLAWLAILAGFFLIQLLACLTGLIRPEFKIPSWWWLFAINNLVITCVAEEALFRGYLQQQLGQLSGWLPAWLIVSVLFGIINIPGGWAYATFVALAGLLYGIAFQVSGRLWVAVLVHFVLNFTHLIFYTYPMLNVYT